MTILEAIDARHSVRAYTDAPIPEEIRHELDAFVSECNKESGLNISVQYDDPAGFDSRLAHYGNFRNVKNYIVLAGRKDEDFDFRCGYYGEKVVLFAQQLGLNTCWAALTFNKKKVRMPSALRLIILKSDPAERFQFKHSFFKRRRTEGENVKDMAIL